MANDLTFNQLAAVLADITAQATGTAPTTPVDTSSFVTVGQLALKTGYDPLATAISQVLSRTIFSVRPYSAKFKMLNVDNRTYGNHIRKLQPVDMPFEEDDRLKLVDGQSIDQYVVLKPKAVQTNFYGAEVVQKHLTIFKDQLDSAFNGPDGFSSFLSMVLTNAGNQIEQAKEATARMALNNLIAGIYAGTNTSQKYNVLAEYNAFAGTSFTTANIFNPQNYAPFARWLFGFIHSVSDFLTERSAAFHQSIGPTTIMRHTPKPDQRLYIQSKFAREIDSVVTSMTRNPDRTEFPPNEKLNYWQNLADPYKISVTPSILDSAGNADRAPQQDIDKVVGILFDREACGITTVNEWSQNTPFNARGGYYNQYWHFTNNYWNDYSENAVIFYMEDVTP